MTHRPKLRSLSALSLLLLLSCRQSHAPEAPVELVAPSEPREPRAVVPSAAAANGGEVRAAIPGGEGAAAVAGELGAASPQPPPAPVSDLLERQPGTWHRLLDGLEAAAFQAPRPSIVGDRLIRVVRVDPAHHEVVLLSALAGHGEPRSAKRWAADHGLLAATNPGMFHPDGRTTGYMRIGQKPVNSQWNRDRAILALDPHDEADPPLRFIDTKCDDRDSVARRYRSLVQSIRMVSCTGANVWSRQPPIWSHAVYGVDGQGRLLLIHARSPYRTHDFVAMLRELPIDLQRLMYGEGGPEAQLYLSGGGYSAEWIGSYETDFYESDGNDYAWDLPNVLGVRRRAGSASGSENGP